MGSWNGFHKSLILIFGKCQIFFFEWLGDGPLKKKTSEHNYLAFLKVVPGTFWAWVQNQKTNLDFQRI